MIKVPFGPGLALVLLTAAQPCDSGADLDGDGVSAQDGDCDDGDAAVYPGAAEICDGLDNDCDALVDDFDPDLLAEIVFEDADGDGAGDPATGVATCAPPAGSVSNAQDCDDGDAGAHQGIPGSCAGTGVAILSPDGGAGAGAGFASIQAALEGAASGATIYLEPGRYAANLRYPRRTVHLVGTYPGRVILDGSACARGAAQCSVVLVSWGREGGALGTAARPRLRDLTLTGGAGTSGAEFGQQASQTHGGGLCVADANPILTGIEAAGNDAGRGGGVFVYHDGPTFEGLIARENVAETGGGIYLSFASPSVSGGVISGNEARSGGGVAVDNGDPRLSDLEISGNAAEFGAGLNLTLASPIVTRAYVHANVAGDIGGGYYVYDSRAQLIGGEISGNTAKSGAGVNLSFAPVRLTDVVVAGNSAVDYGGGIYAYESNATLSGVRVAGNDAGDGGGFNLSYSHLRIEESVVSGNSSDALGAGIYISSSRPQLVNVIVSDNHAGTRGGGIFESYSDVSLEQVTVTGNSAGTLGGGFYAFMESAPTFKGALFAFNTAGEEGGNVAAQESSVIETQYSLFWDGAGAGLVGVETGVGDVVADPRFVNGPEDGSTEGDDYHLRAASPAVDAGPPGPTAEDADGSRADIGAYGGPGGAGL